MNIPPCVLVVDDSPTARRVTEGMLSEAGYEVVTADDYLTKPFEPEQLLDSLERLLTQ